MHNSVYIRNEKFPGGVRRGSLRERRFTPLMDIIASRGDATLIELKRWEYLPFFITGFDYWRRDSVMSLQSDL
jgi:hypothetical protein